MITFLLCLLIASAIFAGAFYLAKYVVSLQHRVHVLEDTFKQAEEHIKTQEEIIAEMRNQIEMMERESVLHSQRGAPNRTWQPGDPLNAGSRT